MALPERKRPIVDKKMRGKDPTSYYLGKKVAKTIKKYRMIEEGDRILVGVSGGKDSLTLHRLLFDRNGIYPNDYELLAVHVSSDLACEGRGDPEGLEEYFSGLGAPLKIVETRFEPDPRGGAYWCARNRRRVLFDTAIRLGYNKLALGHHRNDVLETVMLNMFYHAELSSMLPKQTLFDGRLTLIRPLYAIPEKETARFTRRGGMPVVSCRCPVDGETRREMFKRIIKDIERAHPAAAVNGLRALENVNLEYLPASVDREDMRI
jgi:tRNA 2-thiocytidine biosynthesis protein TtcA